MKEHFFATGRWQGGLYGTVGISGSRTGVSLVSAWISMMKNGVQAYTTNAKRIRDGNFKII